MLRDKIISRFIDSFKEHSPPIAAAGIGGSLGRGKSDVLSDLDFFLLVQDRHLASAVNLLPAWVTSSVNDIDAHHGPSLVDGFGICHAFVHKSGLIVECYVNSPATFTHNSMRQHTRILFDASGRFTSMLAATELSNGIERAIHDLYKSVSTIGKLISRRQILAAHYHLTMLRLVMLSVLAMKEFNRPYNTFDADKLWNISALGRVGVNVARLNATFSAPSILEATLYMYEKSVKSLERQGVSKIVLQSMKQRIQSHLNKAAGR